MTSNWILLLDPFKNLLNAYRMILEEEKYLVETAQNLRDAYQLIKRKQYAVIITEYAPPFEGTDYMIKWVKRNSPETYIIIVTNAAIDEKTYDNLFEIGVDDFILKPYSPERILVHVKKGLKQRDLILKVKGLERLNLLEPITEKIQEVIFNIMFFRKCLRQEIKKARRHHHPFSLLLIQMPDKGKISDRFDSFYTELVKIVKRHVREEDMVGKNNGEIGIILPETDLAGSKALMQRLSGLILTHPQFKFDSLVESYIRTLSFQSYTYPEQFFIPEPLRAVLEEVDKEALHR
ncbi:MAG TPA: response regulator [Thermodesulfobacteriota bacterium]|jgi:diguanylate cyclase (GGDEF)-like protein|nr:response regulator [Thermodesulfobacteriota bacterium]